MNNRYLYRAKRMDSGEWVEGNLITDEHNTNICFIGYLFAMDESGNVHDTDIAKVDKSTICQCTGLKDKNGKMIWENDIVAYHFGKTCAPICFGSYQSCFDNTKTEHVGFYVNWNDKCNYRKDLGYWINMIEVDVVGNVFDNPELLEQEG